MPGIKKTMSEYSEGKLHSGSKKGSVVKSRAQAIAIGLSEERKEGHKVAKNPHKTHEPHHRHKDGAGKRGHDESGHHSHHSEHKKPHHPKGSHTEQGHMPHMEHEHSSHGHPGEHLRLKEEGHTVGHSHKQSEHAASPDIPGEFAKGVHGHPGMVMGMQPKPHGFGHNAVQRHGHHRMSGHPGAHRIGHRK